MQSREEIIRHIFSLTARGIKYDLERMRTAVQRLGNPHTAYKSIHVAGTNGKGSTCAFIASILQCNGIRTGLYTSPHIVDFEERFIIDGKPVSIDTWLAVYQDIEPVIADLTLTFFEIATLVAFELFRRLQVEFAVFETGMGGRLDATNVITPQASVITSLDIDHTEYLGHDRLSIAREKLGIVKREVPLVMIRPHYEPVLELAQETCNQANAPLHFISLDVCDQIDEDAGRTVFEYEQTAFHPPLAGRYQVLNALCAIKTAELLGYDRPYLLAKGIDTAFLPGRFQVIIAKNRTVVFDVAHNPQAAQALAHTLEKRFSDEKICIIIGIMKDKDIRNILAELSRVAGTFIFTQPKIDRASPAQALPEQLPQNASARYLIEPNIPIAITKTFEMTTGPVCITGSFYTVGEAMQSLGIKPYG
jgi:dihydrofolate synthase / folylpolyglutamate synthase